MSLGTATSKVASSASNGVGSASNALNGATPSSLPDAKSPLGTINDSKVDNSLSDVLSSKKQDEVLRPKLKEAPSIDQSSSSSSATISPDDVDNLVDLLEEMPDGGEIDLGVSKAEGEITYSNEGGNKKNSANSNPQNNGKEKVFEDANGNEFKEGDKVEPGREVDENGRVKDSSTKKLAKVAGQAAAAYFTGGESLGADQQVLNNRMVDHTIGVISDTAEKVPGVKEVSEELDDAGVTDTVGDALNLAGDIKNGDIASAAENAEKIKDDTKKVKKYAHKKILGIIIGSFVSLFFFLIIVVAVIGPVIGGFIDITDMIGEKVEELVDFVGDLFGGMSADVAISDWVEGFESLPYEKQRILAAAAALVGRPYQWGGKPTSAGLEGVPSTGLDCSGYVQWVLWTAYGVNPGYLSTSKISDLAQEGKRIKFITEDELEPGDFGLKWLGYREGETNHTGIYAGNGYWFHAANESAGIIRSKYTGFTVYYRYIEELPAGVSGEYASWRQMDSRWKNIYVGNSGKTLGNIGCLITSVAILIEKSGVNTSIVPFNPGTFLQALNRNGGFTSGGSLYYGAITKAVPNFTRVGNVNLRGKTKSEKQQIIKQYIDQGYYLAAEVKGATQNAQHWVAVMGVTSTGVTMVDPASNSTDMWSKYDWSKTSQFNYFKAG